MRDTQVYFFIFCSFSYARILAHYPYVVLLADFVVVATCLIVSITIGGELNFDNPTEVRLNDSKI